MSDMASCVTLFHGQNEHSGKFMSLFRRLGKKKKKALSLKDHIKHRALLKSPLDLHRTPSMACGCERNPALHCLLAQPH